MTRRKKIAAYRLIGEVGGFIAIAGIALLMLLAVHYYLAGIHDQSAIAIALAFFLRELQR